MSSELISRHQIIYSNRNRVPITEIASSLIAMERVLECSEPVFLRLFPGCEISALELYIEEITTGSLWDTYLLRFIFPDDAARDRFVQRIRTITGINFLQGKHEFLGQILAATIAVGAVYAVNKWSGGGTSGVNVRDVQNSIIISAGQNLTIPPDEFARAITDGVSRKSQLASNVVKLIHPAKQDESATITIDQNPALTITSAAIREIPSVAGVVEEEENRQLYTNAELRVRALDLDNNNKGWWVIVPQLGDHRIRMQIDPGIQPARLLGSEVHRGSIEVIYHGTKPRMVYLRNLL